MHTTIGVFACVSADNLDQFRLAMKKGDGIGVLSLDSDDVFENVEHLGIDYVRPMDKGEERDAMEWEFENLTALKNGDGSSMFVVDDAELRIFHFADTFSAKKVLIERMEKAKKILEGSGDNALYLAQECLGLTDSISTPAQFAHGSVGEDGEILPDYIDTMSVVRMLISPWFPRDEYLVLTQAFDCHF